LTIVRKFKYLNSERALLTQKLAHLYGRATSSICLLCHQPDIRIHTLSGCQKVSNQNILTERHNIMMQCFPGVSSKLEQRWTWRKHHFQSF